MAVASPRSASKSTGSVPKYSRPSSLFFRLTVKVMGLPSGSAMDAVPFSTDRPNGPIFAVKSRSSADAFASKIKPVPPSSGVPSNKNGWGISSVKSNPKAI